MSINNVTSDAGQTAPRTLEQFAPMINKYAFKFAKRATAINKAMELEDIKQELSLVFLVCVKQYQEDKGSFMNYVISAWYNHINRSLKKIQKSMDLGYSTVNATVWSEDDEQESFSLFDTIASQEATPEQVVECHQTLHRILDRLSAPARTLVETVINPPPSVMDELDRQATNDIRPGTRTYSRVSLPFLFKLFDIPQGWARSLSVEIKQACDKTMLGK